MTNANLVRALTDLAYSARAAGIAYQPDTGQGFTRVKSGRSFIFRDAKGKPVDSNAKERIQSLGIPPAWKEVWIAPSAKGHIQSTGVDAKGRKQYVYHPKWNAFRNSLKYVRLAAFAVALPRLRRSIAQALEHEGLPRDKVAAAAIDLIDELGIRVGNEAYAKENGTFGVTTLRNRHLSIDGTTITLSFIGKSHKKHELTLQDRTIAGILKKERALPGVHLLQYVDSDGKRHPLTSTDVNQFIKEATGGEFTAKDFRTWIGTVYAYECMSKACSATKQEFTSTAYAKMLRTILKEVAEKLGNTLAVTKSHYVHKSLQGRFSAGELPLLIAKAKRMKHIAGLSRSEAEVAALLTLFARELR